MTPQSPSALWIFGYGSLVWRPAFSFVDRRPARLRGFARRFWQGSTDHRGVPGAPGRVVTLVREPSQSVTGAAFRVDPTAADEILARLDHREKGGYARDIRAVDDLVTGEPFAEALVYRALPGNPNWLGPASLEAIAHQIRGAVGPSGRNDEYVLRLADALPEPDPHVAALAYLLGGRGEGPPRRDHGA